MFDHQLIVYNKQQQQQNNSNSINNSNNTATLTALTDQLNPAKFDNLVRTVSTHVFPSVGAIVAVVAAVDAVVTVVAVCDLSVLVENK